MEYKNVYFLGIGGIGMSALARYFLHEGYAVAGYDRTPSHLTAELEAEGAAVHYEDDVRLIPEGFLDPNDTMVVYTPAVPQDHSEYRYFREHGFCVEKRSQMLGHLAEGKYVMAVAGTHGKTTTSTMVAWLNRVLTGGGSAFLGGISKNFGGNLVLGMEKLLGREAMGGGDIKLLFLTGLFLGWKRNLLCLVAACVIGIVWGLLQKKRDGGEAIPWGPSIALGAWLTALCGQQIIDWYLGLL